MKKLILITILLTSTIVKATDKHMLYLGVGYDKDSKQTYCLLAKECFTKINPFKPSVSVNYLTEVKGNIIFGASITNRGGVLTNFGFSF